ncbi:MAG: hypothetical protein NNA20_13030 [Nitrospira sp.]|nr:hypothetical protein [Nitrospira sp.]MCP9443496.1 hypothetical protein [Nitrospira sp.]
MAMGVCDADWWCRAEEWGPQLPAGMIRATSEFQVDASPIISLTGGSLDQRPLQTRAGDDAPPTIERVSGEEKGPRIPEPMVFDLVRPLGALKGEVEINSLGMIPLSRTIGKVGGATDPLGLVRRSPDRRGVEWAPEIEYALMDGLAVEFELPMETLSVEAYKVAAQATFGTLWRHRFIHGAQVIAQYNTDPRFWTTTWLYLAGLRIDKVWSVFGMVGPRFDHGETFNGFRNELLSNVTVFADVTDRFVAGVETNFAQVLGGRPTLLVMPQVHYEVDLHWMGQAGVGVRLGNDVTMPVIGFRLIREF